MYKFSSRVVKNNNILSCSKLQVSGKYVLVSRITYCFYIILLCTVMSNFNSWGKQKLKDLSKCKSSDEVMENDLNVGAKFFKVHQYSGPCQFTSSSYKEILKTDSAQELQHIPFLLNVMLIKYLQTWLISLELNIIFVWIG